ncbi:MAG TPA: tail fiber protein [Solirubrobacteraceae bacterium]|nr:tail fiber protein [Solirubrobacteraceae bacterium]
MLSRLPHPSHGTVVAYVALFIALGGSAYAVSGRSDAPIHACASKRTGSLRLLRKGRCRRSELAIAWNRQGPAGTVNTSQFYTKAQSDSRYLPVSGTAVNAQQLGGQSASAFAAASLFGSPAPSPSTDAASDSDCILGEIKLTAGSRMPSEWTLAHGQLLSISSNTALYSLLGTTYGGNGTSTFALPNLAGAEPKGAGPAGMNYAICTSGIFP